MNNRFNIDFVQDIIEKMYLTENFDKSSTMNKIDSALKYLNIKLFKKYNTDKYIGYVTKKHNGVGFLINSCYSQQIQNEAAATLIAIFIEQTLNDNLKYSIILYLNHKKDKLNDLKFRTKFVDNFVEEFLTPRKELLIKLNETTQLSEVARYFDVTNDFIIQRLKNFLV